jgi:hypothetical protein
MFVGALALITILDLVVSWNGNPSRSEASFQNDLAGLNIPQNASMPNEEKNLSHGTHAWVLFDEDRPAKHGKNQISKASSEYRMESRSKKFQGQRKKSLMVVGQSKPTRKILPSHDKKDLKRKAQTAVLGILLHRIGK